MAINLPYPIYGKVYDTDGTTLIGSGVTVRARNNTSNEIISITTNSASEYVLDAGNFTSGYDNSDKITVYVIYSNLETETTFTVSDNTHQFNLTLSTVADSTLINYTSVQNVWDELDSLGESDITARRIIKSVQRAEREIEERSGTKFSETTVTNEIYDFNQYSTYLSPEQTEFYPSYQRTDHWNVNFRDRLKLRNRPITSITTLQRNTAGETSTDSWETLTEQTGSGGDYVLTQQSKSSGFVDFVKNKPRYGKRAVRITYKYGYSSTPKNIERLATLMTVRDIVLSKISRSLFDSPNGISLKGITIDRSGSYASYIKLINEEIDRIWLSIGQEMLVV